MEKEFEYKSPKKRRPVATALVVAILGLLLLVTAATLFIAEKADRIGWILLVVGIGLVLAGVFWAKRQ